MSKTTYAVLAFLPIKIKTTPTTIIVSALEKNGNPNVSVVAPETKEPKITPTEKNA